jgi:Fe2+ or Zn2+ uptake regulation protein
MAQAREQIAQVLQQAGRPLTLVEITDALNAQNPRVRTYTFDEIRGHLEQMDEVHESRGTYCLKG